MGKPNAGLWRKDPATPEGKYLVQRRDGSVVEWPNFVIGAKDPAAPAALRAYADEAKRQWLEKGSKSGFNPGYIEDVRGLAYEFETYRKIHGSGDPGKGRHRKDDPQTLQKMRKGGN